MLRTSIATVQYVLDQMNEVASYSLIFYGGSESAQPVKCSCKLQGFSFPPNSELSIPLSFNIEERNESLWD